MGEEGMILITHFKATIGAVSVAFVAWCFAGSAFAADFGPEPSEAPSIEQPQAWQFDPSTDFAKDSIWLEQSLTYGLNGDLDSSGFRLRGDTAYGNYNYLNSDVPGGKVNADVWYGGIWLGYQLFSGNLAYTGWIGSDYQDTDLTPHDPSNVTRGSAFGFSTEAEIENVGEGPLYFDLDGQYSTGFRTYWSRARVGYRFDHASWVIGPEGTFLGDEGFDNQRVGAFVDFPLRLSPTMLLDMSLAGGYSFGGGGTGNGAGIGPGGSSQNSGYFSADFSSRF
jgi:Cellulose biosynthesis protein BcsS